MNEARSWRCIAAGLVGIAFASASDTIFRGADYAPHQLNYELTWLAWLSLSIGFALWAYIGYEIVRYRKGIR